MSIQQNEKYAYEYTAKGHLIGVITNGTAVLGLGNIGALAGETVSAGQATTVTGCITGHLHHDSWQIHIHMTHQLPCSWLATVC